MVVNVWKTSFECMFGVEMAQVSLPYQSVVIITSYLPDLV